MVLIVHEGSGETQDDDGEEDLCIVALSACVVRFVVSRQRCWSLVAGVDSQGRTCSARTAMEMRESIFAIVC